MHVYCVCQIATLFFFHIRITEKKTLTLRHSGFFSCHLPITGLLCLSRRRLLTFAPAFSFCLVVFSVFFMMLLLLLLSSSSLLLLFASLFFCGSSSYFRSNNSKEFEYFRRSYFSFYQHYLTKMS
jgi:hypothetical protein